MRLPWLADVLRAAGLAVVEVGDWQNRGDDLRSVEGIVWHHTVTGPRTSDQAVARLLRDGRPDLAGPLSQLGLDRAGRFHVIAAGKANHNGYGLWGNQSIEMTLCPTCGNKRCPAASDHRLGCTGSNEPGQPGSVYRAVF